MTATVEILHDCEPGTLVCASESLVDCIHAINTYSTFPYLGDEVVFTRWEDGKKVAEARFVDSRYIDYDNCEGNEFTYEEVIKALARSTL